MRWVNERTQMNGMLDMTYPKIALLYSILGSKTFPYSSTGLEMSTVANMETINNQAEDSTKFAPGQRLIK